MKIIKTIIDSEPPRLKTEGKWDKGFVAFVYDCLQKNPKMRPTAEEILEKHHTFFEKAVPNTYIVDELLLDLPKLEERVGPSLYDMGERYKRERDFAQLHKPQSETKWVFEEASAPPEVKASSPIKERVVSKSELYAKMFPEKEVKKDDDDEFDLNKLNDEFQQSSEGLPSVLDRRKSGQFVFLLKMRVIEYRSEPST
eukprot:TRINITY_DN1353_c0_g1_i10.p1 TRINITY_DN1353_c0_g1~~TRINITY_DN1353_c0_g1_i10.p1  ORF type:complete len:198 (-),score=21.18 TRINITY_DN1353_c0_g1_i10:258-851(-)